MLGAREIIFSAGFSISISLPYPSVIFTGYWDSFSSSPCSLQIYLQNNLYLMPNIGKQIIV